jgi:hypothetical protein
MNLSYCYGQYNQDIPILQKMGVRVNSGIPNDELHDSLQRPLLLLLGDLMLQLNNKRYMLASLFTRKSHHFNISRVCY